MDPPTSPLIPSRDPPAAIRAARSLVLVQRMTGNTVDVISAIESQAGLGHVRQTEGNGS